MERSAGDLQAWVVSGHTDFWDYIVKELECDSSSCGTTDGDVKVADCVGHLADS